MHLPQRQLWIRLTNKVHRLGDLFAAGMLADEGESAFNHSLVERWVEKELRQSVCKESTVRGWDQKSVPLVLDDVWYATHCTGHYGYPLRHRFQNDSRYPLAAHRRQYEDIGPPVLSGQVCPERNEAEKLRDA